MTCKKIFNRSILGDDIDVIPDFTALEVIKLLSTGFLFTPDRIEFDVTKYNLYIPVNKCVSVPHYPSTPFLDTFSEVDLRFRRIAIPPISYRFMDIDICATIKERACLGDINSNWLSLLPLPGQQTWLDPQLCCHQPGDWMIDIQNMEKLQAENPCLDVRAIYQSNLSRKENISSNVNKTNDIYKPVTVQVPAVKQCPTVSSRKIVDVTSPNNLVVTKNATVVRSINQVESSVPVTVQKETVKITETPILRETAIHSHEEHKFPHTHSLEKAAINSTQTNYMEPRPDGRYIGCDARFQKLCSDGPNVTTSGVPTLYANPLTTTQSLPSITNSLNGSGNLLFGNDIIEYNPLVAGKKCVKYPSFIVRSEPDSIVADPELSRMIITYTYFPDERSIEVPTMPRTVTLSIQKMVKLFSNVRRSLNYILTSDLRIFTDGTLSKYYYLLLSSGLVSNAVPTVEDAMVAYVVWILTYIGFVGGTHWDTQYWDTACTSVPSNIPWIPVVNFSFSLYDDPSANFNNNLYNVDYLFDLKFLLYADLVLQATYVNVAKRFHRWCSIADGGGWYVLMYPNDMSVEDRMYRHMYIINTLICQQLYESKQNIQNMAIMNEARDLRIASLEFKLGVLVNGDNNPATLAKCPINCPVQKPIMAEHRPVASCPIQR